MATVANAAAPGYVWQDPGDAIMIQVSLDLVDRLNSAVHQRLGPGPRGIEIGGILLGRAIPGCGRAIQVEDFELAPCEHLRGASYTLSPREREMLGARLARRRQTMVVGFFRGHTRPGLFLDQEDFTVFSQYFPNDNQVFLLVRPSAEGPAMGGFFFWEDGDVNRRAPYRQFPFDARMLAGGEYPIAGGPPAPATGRIARPAPVPVPKPISQMPRAARRTPPVPWMLVPGIAAAFLIAGVFVSENRTPKQEAPLPAAKTVPPVPVVPLLPEPVPEATIEAPPVVATPQASPTDQLLSPSLPAKPHRATRKQLAIPPDPPVKIARVTPREVEAPPALSAPVVTKLPAALTSPAAPPPPEVQMTYDQPHASVLRRALHKLTADSADSFVPASPVKKVAPSGLPGAGAVDVKVSIDESGNVLRAQAMTKDPAIADAAMTAARQWRFTPARKHDKPVSSELILHFRF